jgi:hypothetical protein
MKTSEKIEDLNVTGIKVDIVKNILNENGFPAEIESKVDYSLIKSLSGETAYKILLSHMNEKGDGFLNLSFVADYGFSSNLLTSIQLINKYNLAHRFTKGYVNDVGIIKIRTDWFVNYYVSQKQVLTWIQLWNASLILFEAFWFQAKENKTPDRIF